MTALMRRLLDHKKRRRLLQWFARVVLVCLTASTVLITRRAWTDALHDKDDSHLPPIDQGSQPTSLSASSPSNHRLLYIGQFGLGHRLSKLSAAIHLAKMIPLHQVEVYFGHCEAERKTREWDIFVYLFGLNLVQLRDFLPAMNETMSPGRTAAIHHADARSNATKKIVLIRNDVLDYYAAQAYKNARLPLSRSAPLPKLWTDKLDTDVLFFRHLLDRFLQHHGQDYQQLISNQLDDSKFVIGLHIRAGNGESHHFEQAQRGVNSTEQFCQNVVALIHRARQQPSAWNEKRQTLVIFLATDTASVIPIVTSAAQDFNIEVVTAPQARLSPNEGVSYAAWTQGTQCLEGWKASVMDTAVLALRADVVVAAMRSTFTQIVPLALQFNRTPKDRPRFCEVDGSGQSMACFSSRESWLLRDGSRFDSWSVSLSDLDNTTQSTHKVMIHLPDILNGTREYEKGISKIRSFLHEPSGNEYYAHGNRINPKYRSKRLVFRDEWTWKDK